MLWCQSVSVALDWEWFYHLRSSWWCLKTCWASQWGLEVQSYSIQWVEARDTRPGKHLTMSRTATENYPPPNANTKLQEPWSVWTNLKSHMPSEHFRGVSCDIASCYCYWAVSKWWPRMFSEVLWQDEMWSDRQCRIHERLNWVSHNSGPQDSWVSKRSHGGSQGCRHLAEKPSKQQGPHRW